MAACGSESSRSNNAPQTAVLTRRRHANNGRGRQDLLRIICADCPKMDALGNDPCGAHYRDLFA
jgi:cytochrome c1